MKDKMIEALVKWVIRVAEAESMATPAEIAALADVADVLVDYFGASGFISPETR